MRENKNPSQAYLVRNHYSAKRFISSEGWHGHEVRPSAVKDFFGVTAFQEGLNTLSEGLFFLGNFYRTWREMVDELKLKPETHYVKIAHVKGYAFPENLFNRKAFKDLVNGFETKPVEGELER